jgi:purine-binding chemotaxis protein CheW
VSHQYCTFLLDGHLFGVAVSSVQEVLKQQDVTPVPLASREVSGLINLRGQIVTTLDLRTRLGLPRREDGSRSVSVVVRAADGGPVSLVVDQIGDVIEADEAALEPPPDTVPHELRELVLGICKLDEQLMLLLDTERAVAVADAAA